MGHSRSSAIRRGRLRFFYFGISAIWGFVVGVGTASAGPLWRGAPQAVVSEPLVLGGIGLVASLLGGMLVCRAYRDAARRGSR
jgi:hypothetical protein